MAVYALTLFLSAFLLFQVQPLIGKYILPWFGGGPGVWTTCMLFFQVLLLGGYAYAHLTSRLLKARAQVVLHCLLLAAALALLPIVPSDSWKPTGGGSPVAEILLLLAASLGLPYFVLSSTGPLLQQWFSRAHPGVAPYRLYALSNAGSLLALLSYPFVVENHFPRLAQAKLWGWAFGAFVLGCGFCAAKLWQWNPSEAATLSGGDAAESPRPSTPVSTRLLWLLLPACASVLLLATTNKLCQDVAVMPFLWVLPLGIYLATFILCFDNPRWYWREAFAVALVAASTAVVWALFQGTDLSLRWQVAVYTSALFVCCMVCHGELYRLRPDPRHLTGFYLSIAAGGALGGVVVAVVSPLIFPDYYEMHWALLLCGVLFTIVCAGDRASTSSNLWRWPACALTLVAAIGVDALIAWSGRRSPNWIGPQALSLRLVWWSVTAQAALLWVAVRRGRRTFEGWRRVACVWLALGTIVLGATLWHEAHDLQQEIIARSRNFYGTLRVYEYGRDQPDGHYVLLDHGHTTHGLQFVEPEAAASWPTTYYGEESGLGKGIAALPDRPRRLGMVGLGTGTMAAYGRPGDTLRIYEIDPDVVRVANSHFSYLRNCPASVEVVLGDARLSMEHEPPQGFDLLALDAFSSDAIPVHLLTEEAFELYLRHLEPSGVIAVHLSNRYLNLLPVMRNVAERFDLGLAIVEFTDDEDAASDQSSGEGDVAAPVEEGEGEAQAEGEAEGGGEAQPEWWLYSSTWALLTRDRALLDRPEILDSAIDAGTYGVVIPRWTDDFASLFQVLK